MLRLLIPAVLLALLGCSTGRARALSSTQLPSAPADRGGAAIEPIEEPPKPVPLGERIAARAAVAVGARSVKKVDRSLPNDCTGLVRFAYALSGVDLFSEGVPGQNGVSAMLRLARKRGALHRGVPLPGDLIFFRETYDWNRDGRRNDGMTHIGVVESVDAEGTVTFIHRGRRGIHRSRVTPARPRERLGEAGHVLNEYLRPASARLRAYLTGELFSGYASAAVLVGERPPPSSPAVSVSAAGAL